MKTKGLKKFTNLFLICIIVLIGNSCGTASDPEPVNEEEVITTVNLIFTNASDENDVIVASFQDLDGPGGNDGTTINPTLSANTVYNVRVEFLNESVTPEIDITTEVEEEGDDHQVFYVTSSSLDFGLTYQDQDSNGFPIGIISTMDVGAAGVGTMNVILVHLPIKSNSGVNEGNIANSGGDEDVNIAFVVTVI